MEEEGRGDKSEGDEIWETQSIPFHSVLIQIPTI